MAALSVITGGAGPPAVAEAMAGRLGPPPVSFRGRAGPLGPAPLKHGARFCFPYAGNIVADVRGPPSNKHMIWQTPRPGPAVPNVHGIMKPMGLMEKFPLSASPPDAITCPVTMNLLEDLTWRELIADCVETMN